VSPVRVCVVYDCLFPYTIGGAERWYRSVAERLAADGHEVTYLTLRQWPRGETPDVPGVRVRAVGPRMRLYGRDGNRRVAPPLAFGLGVFAHLLVSGTRYDVVHTGSFPYFSVLAAGALRRPRRFRVVVDWHEVWSRAYWREYLGRAGAVGWHVQRLCTRVPQIAYCFSRLHRDRLRDLGVENARILTGEYAGELARPDPSPPEPVVVYAGRHIPEKRLPALVPAIALAAERMPELRGAIYGDGPERPLVEELVARHRLDGRVTVHGFVPSEEVDRALRSALCMVLPSRREGYGLVVVEAAARGVPSVVVAGEDNAATELVEDGVNGFVAASASPQDLADAIEHVYLGGQALRDSTADWFAQNARRLSLDESLRVLSEGYGSSAEASRSAGATRSPAG
jgi:glycosyltransferase involved in cell wall biosynthesis